VNGDALISDALRVCGGHKRFCPLQKMLTPLVSREQILGARPEAIVTGGFGKRRAPGVKGLESVPAVRTGEYAIDPDRLHAQAPT